MGYMGLEHSDASDMACAAKCSLEALIIKFLQKELKETGNEFNTSGAVNVGFIFDELLAKGNYNFRDVAQKCIEKLDEKIKAAKKGEWPDKENQQYHLKHYRRLKKSVEKFT